MATSNVNNIETAPTGARKKVTPIGEHLSVDDFTKAGFKEVVDTTKTLNAFPQGASRDLYCAYPSFGRVIDIQSERLLKAISLVLKMNNIRGNIERRQEDEQFEMLLECNDAILERLNYNLDEMAGIKKAYTPAIGKTTNFSLNNGGNAGSWNLKRSSNSLKANFAATKCMERPQNNFKTLIDNSIDNAFVPKIKDKPNSLKPLAILPEYDETGKIASYVHPYEFELMKFEVPEEQLAAKNPKMPEDLEKCDWLYVDTVENLKTCLNDLRKYKEIAIDVEHHSYRTFLGITCLVQISTRDKDYLIDALALRDEVYILNEVFTNPKIVKILHGADSDVEWLQRDLALYLVNMFDTHQAAKALDMSRLSLSYLLKYYCNLDVDKTFQLADWRIRPLPEDLIKYARQDTHYLIYVYERLVNDLLKASNGQTNFLKMIYQKSTEICKKRYVKPVIDDETHLDLFRKSKRIFDNRQLYALKDLYKWRDSVARQEDESIGYVLPNHMLLQISESLPREMQGILACCNPIPPLVKQHLHSLHQIILRAREQPLVKPILEKEPIYRVAQTLNAYDNVLYCPHDNSHLEEFRDDLPTLISFKKGSESPEARITTNPSEEKENTNPPLLLKEPDVKIFNKISEFEQSVGCKEKAEEEKQKIIRPYLRYLAILPEVEKEKQAEAERLHKELMSRQLCPAANPDIKTEEEANVKNENPNDDDLYRLPIKEMLKRKRNYDDEVDRKPVIANGFSPEHSEAKRFKNVTPTDDKLKFVNLPPTKKGKKQFSTAAATPNSSTATFSSQEPTSLTTNASCSISEKSSEVVDLGEINSDSDEPEEVPISSKPLVTDVDKYDKKLKKKNKKQFKAKQRFQHPQSSNKPIQLMQAKNQSHQSNQEQGSTSQASFDYKNVDFKRFQGGAQKAKGPEIKGQFHAKSNSNKSKNKKFNKLFTFSNVKNNKK